MKKIKKIMLIQPPVTRPKDFSAKATRVSIFFPLGIAYLGAVLEKTGRYEVRILDALCEGDAEEPILLNGGEKLRYGLSDEEIAERIREFAPDVVGCSCLFSMMQQDMVNVCRIAKTMDPGIATVTGGTHAGSIAEDILTGYDDVDFVVVGEAETTFLDFLSALEAGTGFSDLNGFAFRENGTVKVMPKTEYIEDLDSIPFPARHLFNMDRYFDLATAHGLGNKGSRFTQMVTSRGCPCRCTFCGLGSHWGSRQRMRSPKNVLDEMEYLVKEYGINEIHLEDENFTAKKRRAIEICDGIIERKLKIRWHPTSGTAVYSLDEELLEKMSASGCYSLTLGIESGNQNVITTLMNKPVNLKKVPGIVRKIRQLGMDVRAFFIIGYPGETRETIAQTIEFAKTLELDWVYFSLFSPLPKTKIYDTCIEKGYIKEGDFDPMMSFHKAIVHTPEFDPEYLHEVREEAIVDTCFRNNPNLLKYDIDKAIESFSGVVERYPHFDFANFYLGEAYLKKGDKKQAIDSYKKTLIANEKHKEAMEKLKFLGAEMPLAKKEV